MADQPAPSKPQAAPRKKKRRLLKVLLAIVALLVFLHLPIGNEGLRISPETTLVTGPLRPDGTVDYIAAFNAECSKDVTPENNAAPLLARALGSGFLGPGTVDERTEKYDKPDDRVLGPLGLRPDGLDGNDTFVSWSSWLLEVHGESATRGDGNDSLYPDDETYDDPSLLLTRLWAGQKHPQIDPWLKRNEGALELVAKASRRSRYYVPSVCYFAPITFGTSSVESVRLVTDAAMALRVRSVVYAKMGHLDGAWEDVLAIHRLARLIGQKPLILHKAVAWKLDGLAAQSGIHLATRWPVPEGLAQYVVERLNRIGRPGPLRGGLWGERLIMLDLAQKRYGDASRLPFDQRLTVPVFLARSSNVNALLERTNWWYDRQDRAMETPSLRARIAALDALAREKRGLSTGWELAEITGLWGGGWPCRGEFSRKLVDKAIPMLPQLSLGGAERVAAGSQARCTIEVTAIALARFHEAEKRWPLRLDELVPKYADAVPLDVFTGGPIAYISRPDGYLLHSVGPNMRDDQGRSGAKGADDIVASIPAEPTTRGS